MEYGIALYLLCGIATVLLFWRWSPVWPEKGHRWWGVPMVLFFVLAQFVLLIMFWPLTIFVIAFRKGKDEGQGTLQE